LTISPGLRRRVLRVAVDDGLREVEGNERRGEIVAADTLDHGVIPVDFEGRRLDLVDRRSASALAASIVPLLASCRRVTWTVVEVWFGSRNFAASDSVCIRWIVSPTVASSSLWGLRRWLRSSIVRRVPVRALLPEDRSDALVQTLRPGCAFTQ